MKTSSKLLYTEMGRKLLVTVGITFIFAFSSTATADFCETMEREGPLIFQQMKKSKMCKDSAVGKGWTDCWFKGGGTEILLAGAIGVKPEARILGLMGSGFYVLSTDPSATVRIITDEQLGLLLQIDGKDNLSETGRLYNEAYITVFAQVLVPVKNA